MGTNKLAFLLTGLSLLLMSACGGGDEDPVLVPAFAGTFLFADCS